jgi:hypothetical protein
MLPQNSLLIHTPSGPSPNSDFLLPQDPLLIPIPLDSAFLLPPKFLTNSLWILISYSFSILDMIAYALTVLTTPNKLFSFGVDNIVQFMCISISKEMKLLR